LLGWLCCDACVAAGVVCYMMRSELRSADGIVH
jgi:hypothetical protein